jgi:hypothetical protein
MTRFLALLLAVFIGGPTCFCVGGEIAAPPPPSEHRCCHAEEGGKGEGHSSKEAPLGPCGCSKCLVQRDQAGDPPRVPTIPWSFAAPLLTELSHDITMRDTAFAWVNLIDTGPPHERQAIFVRHCALLL